MYYSVTFTDSSGTKMNTWKDWRLIPSSPPIIEPPEPYTNYADIPGRVEGPIDLSEALTGRPTYQTCQGQWQFIAMEDGYTRPVLYQILKDFLHGKRVRIELEEDPFHYYLGRTAISAPKTGKGNTMYTISYVVAPVRYLLDGTPEGF